MSSVVAPKSFCMAGMATLTMLTSSTDMNMPVTRTIREIAHGPDVVGVGTAGGAGGGRPGADGRAGAGDVGALGGRSSTVRGPAGVSVDIVRVSHRRWPPAGRRETE